MNLAAYTSPLDAFAMPTGVGQHIVGMFSALQRREDVAFSLVAPRGKEGEGRKFISAHPRSRLVPVPWPDRLLRYATACASLVNLDWWMKDIDWVYVPVEQPVTTCKKLAVTVHDLYAFEPQMRGVPNRRPPGLNWRVRMNRILERADLIVTVSEFTRSRLLDLFDVANPGRIVVIGNGGSEGFGPTPHPGDAAVLRRSALQARRYVLFPASLTHRKGGDLLLEVARLAHAQQTGLNFVVIGRRHDADLLEAFERMKQKTPELPVTMLGYVTKSDLAALYRHAHAVFLPSRYEGFGIPIVEALASGCPVFITNQAALVEVAASRAEIVEPDAATALVALTAHHSRRLAVSDSERTWADCAARLVRAMKGGALFQS